MVSNWRPINIPNHIKIQSNFISLSWNCAGVCRMDGKQAMRRKASTTSSRLQVTRECQSCPSSPRHSKNLNLRTTPSTSSATLNEEDIMPSTSRAFEKSSNGLHRSPSSGSHFRQRSSPSGLFSYTGSQPPSRNASRSDLTEEKPVGSVSNCWILWNTWISTPPLAFRWFIWVELEELKKTQECLDPDYHSYHDHQSTDLRHSPHRPRPVPKEDLGHNKKINFLSPKLYQIVPLFLQEGSVQN